MFTFVARKYSSRKVVAALAPFSRRTFATDLGNARLNTLPATGTKTKIIATIGPASEDKIQELVEEGMHVARLNFSHAGSDYSYPEMLLQRIRGAKGKHTGLSVGAQQHLPNNLRAILVDTKGPEIRTGPLPGDQDVMQIETGAEVTLCVNDVSQEAIASDDDTSRRIHIDYEAICSTVHVGSLVLLDCLLYTSPSPRD